MFLFSACSSTGKSAYELAVEQGFEGTLNEWLASLKGTNGENAPKETSYDIYLKAKELGEYNGSYVDFVRDVLTIKETVEGVVINNCIPSVVTVSSGSGAFGTATGSGVIYQIDSNNNAFILTNYHVAEYGISNNSYKLNFYGCDSNKTFTAKYVGGSKTYDLAVLYAENCQQLEDYNAKAVTLNTSDPLMGSKCFAIGNTNGQGISITSGCISVDSEQRSQTSGGYTCSHRVIRHDAYTHGGNSGGGLFNANGELIGITNGGLSAASTNNSDNMIKFAIPASVIKGVANNIIKNCFNQSKTEIQTFNFGFEYYISESHLSFEDLTTKVETILIESVSNTLSSKNIQENDKIVSLTLKNNSGELSQTVTRIHHVEDLLLLADSSHTLILELSRNGINETFTVEIDLNTLAKTEII
jgi:S1-C subfamily serine protease